MGLSSEDRDDDNHVVKPSNELEGNFLVRGALPRGFLFRHILAKERGPTVSERLKASKEEDRWLGFWFLPEKLLSAFLGGDNDQKELSI